MATAARIPITPMLREARSADRNATAASRDRLYSAIYPELKKSGGRAEDWSIACRWLTRECPRSKR